jgi:hypothetical protein
MPTTPKHPDDQDRRDEPAESFLCSVSKQHHYTPISTDRLEDDQQIQPPIRLLDVLHVKANPFLKVQAARVVCG